MKLFQVYTEIHHLEDIILKCNVKIISGYPVDEKYKTHMKSTQIYSELNQITKQKSKILMSPEPCTRCLYLAQWPHVKNSKSLHT